MPACPHNVRHVPLIGIFRVHDMTFSIDGPTINCTTSTCHGTRAHALVALLLASPSRSRRSTDWRGSIRLVHVRYGRWMDRPVKRACRPRLPVRTLRLNCHQINKRFLLPACLWLSHLNLSHSCNICDSTVISYVSRLVKSHSCPY